MTLINDLFKTRIATARTSTKKAFSGFSKVEPEVQKSPDKKQHIIQAGPKQSDKDLIFKEIQDLLENF